MGERALPPTAVVAVVAAALAGIAPWHRSGTVERSGVAIVRSAERLGFIDEGVQAAVVATWRVLPVVAALAVLALTLDRPVVASALAAGGGAVAVVVGAVVLAAPGALAAGPTASVVAGGLALLAGGLALLLAGRRRLRRPPAVGRDDGSPGSGTPSG